MFRKRDLQSNKYFNSKKEVTSNLTLNLLQKFKVLVASYEQDAHVSVFRMTCGVVRRLEQAGNQRLSHPQERLLLIGWTKMHKAFILI